MTSKVRYHMFPCDNRSNIEVSMTDDGDFEVKATSTCPKVEKFLNGLSPLSMTDLTDKAESKVFREFLGSDMSANCLTPSAVLTAAWVEAGMISKRLATKEGSISVHFID